MDEAVDSVEKLAVLVLQSGYQQGQNGLVIDFHRGRKLSAAVYKSLPTFRKLMEVDGLEKSTNEAYEQACNSYSKALFDLQDKYDALLKAAILVRAILPSKTPSLAMPEGRAVNALDALLPKPTPEDERR